MRPENVFWSEYLFFSLSSSKMFCTFQKHRLCIKTCIGQTQQRPTILFVTNCSWEVLWPPPLERRAWERRALHGHFSRTPRSWIAPGIRDGCFMLRLLFWKIKTAENTKENRAKGTRLRHKRRQRDEKLTLISVLVSTAGGAQRHPGGRPRFHTCTCRL